MSELHPPSCLVASTLYLSQSRLDSPDHIFSTVAIAAQAQSIASVMRHPIRFAVVTIFCLTFRSYIIAIVFAVFSKILDPIDCASRWVYSNSVPVMLAFMTIVILDRMTGMLTYVPHVADAVLVLRESRVRPLQ